MNRCGKQPENVREVRHIREQYGIIGLGVGRQKRKETNRSPGKGKRSARGEKPQSLKKFKSISVPPKKERTVYPSETISYPKAGWRRIEARPEPGAHKIKY